MYQVQFTLDDSKNQAFVSFVMFVIEPTKFVVQIPTLLEKEEETKPELSD